MLSHTLKAVTDGEKKLREDESHKGVGGGISEHDRKEEVLLFLGSKDFKVPVSTTSLTW